MSIDYPLIKQGDKVASAGSCFASNLVPYLTRSGFTYLQTELRHPSFKQIPPENLGYDKFSAAYGNIYTARQLLQLLRRSRSMFWPSEDRWITSDAVIDPFRPGLKYYATSNKEFDLLTRQHLKACLRVFSEADVFIFTLGLTEAWVSREDGAVFPACPGTVAGDFNPEKHLFKNFSVLEMTADLKDFIRELREINADVRIILTVSPVPLVATATANHVICASTYSKSALRVVAEEVSTELLGVTYFPAYEIVTGPQAPKEYFEDDRRNVSIAAVDQVMEVFLACCEQKRESNSGLGPDKINTPEPPKPNIELLSKKFADIECEELMVETKSRSFPG